MIFPRKCHLTTAAAQWMQSIKIENNVLKNVQTVYEFQECMKYIDSDSACLVACNER